MKYYSILFALFTGLFLTSCEEVEDFVNNALGNDEVVAGLKQALEVSTDTSVNQAHQTNGFYGRQAIKILFPQEAAVVENVVGNIPGGQILIDELVLKLNRAAEEAAIKAKPIFIGAITNITIQDGFQILKGADTAATHYLKQQTRDSLFTAFKPDIENALTSVGAQQAWSQLINRYNQVPLVQPVNTDLAAYTTDEALQGLFFLVSEEEKKIRNDVSHRVTDLLKRVFDEQNQ